MQNFFTRPIEWGWYAVEPPLRYRLTQVGICSISALMQLWILLIALTPPPRSDALTIYTVLMGASFTGMVMPLMFLRVVRKLLASDPGDGIGEEELEAISKRSNRATLGPWKSFIEGRDHMSGSSFIQTMGEDIEFLGASNADQDFMAHARHDVPRLVKEVRRLRSANRSRDEK